MRALGLKGLRPKLGRVKRGKGAGSGGPTEARVAITRRKRGPILLRVQGHFAQNPFPMLNMPRTNSSVPKKTAFVPDCPTMTTSFFCN